MYVYGARYYRNCHYSHLRSQGHPLGAQGLIRVRVGFCIIGAVCVLLVSCGASEIELVAIWEDRP